MTWISSMAAKPAVKFGAIALVALALVGGTVWVLRGEFSKGEKAGAAGVTNAVQTETIRRTNEALQDKERANEKARDTPIDSVIDGLR